MSHVRYKIDTLEATANATDILKKRIELSYNWTKSLDCDKLSGILRIRPAQ